MYITKYFATLSLPPCSQTHGTTPPGCLEGYWRYYVWPRTGNKTTICHKYIKHYQSEFPVTWVWSDLYCHAITVCMRFSIQTAQVIILFKRNRPHTRTCFNEFLKPSHRATPPPKKKKKKNCWLCISCPLRSCCRKTEAFPDRTNHRTERTQCQFSFQMLQFLSFQFAQNKPDDNTTRFVTSKMFKNKVDTFRQGTKATSRSLNHTEVSVTYIYMEVYFM